MNKPSHQRVIILGGYGAFGKLISDQVTKIADTVIAGRSAAMGQKFAASLGAEFVVCDAKDTGSLKAILAPGNIVINASGPFVPNAYSIPETCIEGNCHYIDLADNREYVSGFSCLDARAKEKAVFACTGASTTPAVTHSLASAISRQFSNIGSLHIYLSAGNKNKPGISTIESILSYTGTPVRVWNDGEWKIYPGWGLAEYYDFPRPVGKRRVQLCNVPDLDLFPNLLRANRVILKAGVELLIFNLALSILGELKQRVHSIKLPALARPLLVLSRLFKVLGSYSGGVMVSMEGNRQKITSGMVTSQNGSRIPTSPAVLLARRMLLQDGPPSFGAFPCIGFITLEEFREYLEPFGIAFVTRHERISEQ